MLEHLIERLKQDQSNWDEFSEFFCENEIPAKTVLLREGEIARNIFFIKKGCLRLWFNNEGKDITFQFFFEHQAVSSFESFFGHQPSLFTMESIEPTTVVTLSKNGFDVLYNHYPDLKDSFQQITLQRMGHFGRLFLSRIKDNPQKRYHQLLINNPEIVQRVPQHYVASYLGITPISLSRIRNKR